MIVLYIKYRTMRFRFDHEGIWKRQGLLWRHETNLAYRRIQDIHLTNGIIQRWLGLATVSIQTAAGSSTAEVTIEGVRPSSGETVHSIRPSAGYLRYLKLLFWVAFLPGDIVPIILWLAIATAFPIVGVMLAVLLVVVLIAPDVLAYVGLHLRYDTTWYGLTDRSLRIRWGLWVIHETTITFENVQNVEVAQGLVQRYFGKPIGFAELSIRNIVDGSIVDWAGRGRPERSRSSRGNCMEPL